MSWLIIIIINHIVNYLLPICNLIIIVIHYTPTLSILEEYSADNVTVTVEWPQQVGAAYITRVLPPVLMMFNENTSLQLLLEYNTEYNLSMVVVTPCGNATISIILNYGWEDIHIHNITIVIMTYFV